ncbi:iron-sulfur cluster repair protein YtfE [Roseovarius sp. A-2]|uniref:hemerythrin domain-containing protein n=1 Tax=Roseovarius sp. A-2 TaxID=1570360 RepID=UPI0009B55669|nr:hemerythrin domain-containing protein [Roseovarius sp. A-2]GAW36686.1 iron-sulfur cluster repair protein YtfE [Roseovarius sp. A-2]
MQSDPDVAVPDETGELIAHILSRYHETHRRELPELLALARKVETSHATDPNSPHGLTRALELMIADLEDHMRREEANVFASLATGDASAGAGIAGLRHDHEAQEAALNRIAAITHGFRLPAYACRSWTQLYAGLGKLAEDLDEHRYLEDSVLFPRLDAGR